MFHYYKTRHIFNAKLHRYTIATASEITEQEYFEADAAIIARQLGLSEI